VKIKIRPASDTFESNAKPLFAGEVYSVPEDLSAEDAAIILDKGKADVVADGTGGPESKKTTRKVKGTK
jgi:hypothetical protein